MNLSFLPKFQKILASLIISEFRRLSQEDLEFGVSWVYIARPSLLIFTHTYTNQNLEYWCSYYPLKIILLSAFLFPDMSILCFLILLEINWNQEKFGKIIWIIWKKQLLPYVVSLHSNFHCVVVCMFVLWIAFLSDWISLILCDGCLAQYIQPSFFSKRCI